MSNSIRDDLLGYLLDALDPEERQRVEEHLRGDATLREELAILRDRLAVLVEEPHCEPPPGLAMNTCGFVRNHVARTAQAKVELAPGPPARQWRFVDAAVAAAIVVAVTALLFPVINMARANAQVTACSNKLREVGVALTSYSAQHEGLFPAVAEKGNLAAGGIYAPTLMSAGFLSDPYAVVCPASDLAANRNFHVPTLDQLRSASGDALKTLQTQMGGSYGYALGYRENGKYNFTRNHHREGFALAADMPADDCSSSPNHGRCGHNVLLEDGHVVYLRSCRLDTSNDDIFRNDLGLVAAGCQVNDAVVVRSDVSP